MEVIKRGSKNETLFIILMWLYNFTILAATVFLIWTLQVWWPVLLMLFVQVVKNVGPEKIKKEDEVIVDYESKFN